MTTRTIQISFTLSEDDLQTLINEVGIDAEISKLTDDQFNKIKTAIEVDGAHESYMDSIEALGESLCEVLYED